MAYEKVRISELPQLEAGATGLEVVGISNGHTVRALVSTAAAISGELEQKVKELQAAINEANQLRATLEETIMQLLGDEEAERREEDASIRQEVKRVSKALGDRLGAEIAAREAGDGQLASDIHAEGQKRTTAINTLHGRITQEGRERREADQRLEQKIDGISGAYDWGQVIEEKAKEIHVAYRFLERYRQKSWENVFTNTFIQFMLMDIDDDRWDNLIPTVKFVLQATDFIHKTLFKYLEAIDESIKALNSRDTQHRRMLLECKEHVKTLEMKAGISPDWEPKSDWN
ncbi:MAG: hypothetical protein CSA97_05790 [Bacteroidetes bacterium]|nr:MAG: hypothetical protein CSA97_05790 [Bacteroidota bacterium]